MQADIIIKNSTWDKFEAYSQGEIMKQLIARLRAGRRSIEQNMRLRVSRDFLNSTQANELVYGILRFDLGLKADESTNALEDIARVISDDLHFTITMVGNQEVDAIVSFIKSDYSEVLSLSSGSFISKKGQKVDWLNWLLQKGGEKVVTGFHVAYVSGKKADYSRSGGALMYNKGAFIIPDPFKGTFLENFITRAFENIEIYIQAEILRVIK